MKLANGWTIEVVGHSSSGSLRWELNGYPMGGLPCGIGQTNEKAEAVLAAEFSDPESWPRLRQRALSKASEDLREALAAYEKIRILAVQADLYDPPLHGI